MSAKTPPILSADGLHVRYGEQHVLNAVSLTIHEGERIGLMGRNGAGKSTLLRILAGADEADSGNLSQQRDLVTGFLPQEFELDDNASVAVNVRAGVRGLLGALAEFESGSAGADRAGDLEKQLNQADAWELERRIKIIGESLSLPPDERIAGSLSGGERRRVALAQALVRNPKFLILDEPTNHLDVEVIKWLERYLASYKGTLLLVTHDRYFLDRICTRMLELSHGQIYSYTGNYSDFLQRKSERLLAEEKAEGRRQSFLRRELDWVKRGPKARTTKSKSRLDRYYEAENQRAPERDRDVDLVIPPAGKLGNKIVNLNGLSCERGGKRLFDGVDFEFTAGMRLGIIGPNGCGKTSLLTIMQGALEPTTGSVDIGQLTRFNVIDQHRESLDDSKTALEEIGEGNDFVMVGDQKLTVWSYLKRFLFTDQRIRTKVGRLSGGERNRLLLAKILKFGGNFLILDEPTNDLDLETLRILEEALLAFTGCCCIVSHDRYFLNRVCTGILAFEDGKIVYQEGDYDYYCRKLDERSQPAPATAKATTAKPKSSRPKKLSWKEQRELEQIEENILNAEGAVEELEALFADDDFYAKYRDQIDDLTAQLDTARLSVADLYARWEHLEARQAELANG
jgi:ATP-binding cassette subfamily F protein uup